MCNAKGAEQALPLCQLLFYLDVRYTVVMQIPKVLQQAANLKKLDLSLNIGLQINKGAIKWMLGERIDILMFKTTDLKYQ